MFAFKSSEVFVFEIYSTFPTIYFNFRSGFPIGDALIMLFLSDNKSQLS